MHGRLWQLLLLLLGLPVSSEAQDCYSENHPVTVQLSRTHILRTWQPDGAHCRWWEDRQSETNQFPAAVRSGPRWLVMQLRQPMMLGEVKFRSWDSQWQTAAPVGSPVSALGASSLPLELQLQDPCRASWETFSSSDDWMPLGLAMFPPLQTMIRFLLVSSFSNVGLNWSGINVTGLVAPLSVTAKDNSLRPFSDISALKEGSRVCLSVSSCGNGSLVQCRLKLKNGSTQELHQIGSEFEFNASLALHETTFACLLGYRPLLTIVLIEQTVGIIVLPANLSISVSPVWVSGRSVTVSVTSSPAYPAQKHNCSIISGNTVWNLDSNCTNIETAVSRNQYNQTVASVTSLFRLKVDAAMLNGNLKCDSKEKSLATAAIKSDSHFISQISEPCVTVIDLSKIQNRIVRVKSQKCSIWSVRHLCWLNNPFRNISAPLSRISEYGFSSTHLLKLPEDLDQQNWMVRCSVNQSGLMYPDVTAFFPTKMFDSTLFDYRLALVCLLLLIFVASILVLGCTVARMRCKAESTSGPGRNIMNQNFSSRAPDQQLMTARNQLPLSQHAVIHDFPMQPLHGYGVPVAPDYSTTAGSSAYDYPAEYEEVTVAVSLQMRADATNSAKC